MYVPPQLHFWKIVFLVWIQNLRTVKFSSVDKLQTQTCLELLSMEFWQSSRVWLVSRFILTATVVLISKSFSSYKL